MASGAGRSRLLPGRRLGVLGPGRPSSCATRRLDQNTTITFTPPPERAGTWIDLVAGAARFLHPDPRRLGVTTATGSIEGTEFLVEVEVAEARISVWEGRVLAENAQGSLTLAPEQSAVARAPGRPRCSAQSR